MKYLMMTVIRFYQRVISRYFLPGAHCRFTPTCSQYSYMAYEKYGFLKGTYLTVRRLLKCHPLHRGGYDPLP